MNYNLVGNCKKNKMNDISKKLLHSIIKFIIFEYQKKISESIWKKRKF